MRSPLSRIASGSRHQDQICEADSRLSDPPRMFQANTTRTALLKLEQLSADEEQYGYVFKIFESMVPKKTLIKMTPDRKAWLAHPKWSKIPQDRCADHGRELFKRSFYRWERPSMSSTIRIITR